MSRVAYFRQLSHDELYTFYIARLPRPQLYAALMTGADQHPVPFYLASGWCLRLLGNNELALRVPALISGWVLAMAMLVLVGSRTSVLYGLVASLLMMNTAAGSFAVTARGYMPAVAFLALAVVCWQRAREHSGWKLGLALALAGSVSSHYYAALGVVPLAIGEAIRTRRSGLDPATWLSMALAAAPIAASWSLIEAARPWAATFWGRPAWSELPDYYSFVLGDFTVWLGLFVVLLPLWQQRVEGGRGRVLDPAERGVLFGFRCLARTRRSRGEDQCGHIRRSVRIACGDRRLLVGRVGASPDWAWRHTGRDRLCAAPRDVVCAEPGGSGISRLRGQGAPRSCCGLAAPIIPSGSENRLVGTAHLPGDVAVCASRPRQSSRISRRHRGLPRTARSRHARPGLLGATTVVSGRRERLWGFHSCNLPVPGSRVVCGRHPMELVVVSAPRRRRPASAGGSRRR